MDRIDFIAHQITPEGMVYSRGIATKTEEIEKFVTKEVKKALRKSKHYEFKEIQENNIFADLGKELLKDCDYSYFVNSTQLLAAELCTIVGEEDTIDVIFVKFTDRRINGFMMLLMDHAPQIRSVAEYIQDDLEVVLRVNQNVIKSRSGCTKAAILYKNGEDIYLKVLDLDVDKNKVKLEDSSFINSFIKAEPVKDDAYMSELFYKETEKYFNKVQRVNPEEKSNILLGLTYEAKVHFGEEFSTKEFAQIYVPLEQEQDYLDYLKEKGVEEYFKLLIRNQANRQLKVRGANVKVDAAMLDDPNKVKIVKRGEKYDLVIKDIDYLY